MQKKYFLEAFLENSREVKQCYLKIIHYLRSGLNAIGLLAWLDKRVHQKRRYHFFRSLFAIHQLEDFIVLEVPWWTYSAIKAVENAIQQFPCAPVVLEYGSGASTLWLAKRCAQVFSVEHDKGWYLALKKELTLVPHVSLILKEPYPENNALNPQHHSWKLPNLNFQSYIEVVKELGNQFDIIIIDGRCREACLKAALPYLKPSGIIIFDNANRKRYQAALAQSNLTIQRFGGFAPGSPFPSETAILQHKD